MTHTALYDIPGPRTRRRHRLYGVVSTLVILALLAWFGYLLYDTGQFEAQKWRPFQYEGIQELLLRGLGNTLKAFAYAAVLALALGALLAAGRLSDHRPVRWLATLLVEFFRAMPVLVMIFFVFVALKVQPLPALVTGLTLYNGSVLAEVFRTGVNSVDRGQREAAYSLGMRKTHVMSYVLVPQGVRAMLPAIISQLVVALKDTSLGFLITYEEFLHAGKLIAGNLDYDLPFIPVVLIISPIYIGMCMLLSWFANWVAKRQRRNPKVGAAEVAEAQPGTLLPGVGGGPAPGGPGGASGGSRPGGSRPGSPGPGSPRPGGPRPGGGGPGAGRP
ncbi:amino acid ABC transporter permease [Streptomyces sp. AC536]|uniref:amino acid ABC transporter permease n=1 Tax=Streptomyces buecherae TaxID=2763006 RepID=UPI00164EA56B|nr:amino acid ABC transporter permease [Streptomyces buecherae]MBC3982888.1 amino acid ABC transporter permease [Streptomyces buecherae]QNJ39419.1 amino acid ABC transporter permease [Streptomyces buecherae]